MNIWQNNAALLSDSRRDLLTDIEPARIIIRSPEAAQKWAKAYPKDSYVYLVPGFGDGKHVRALYDHISAHSLIIVLERDMAMLRLGLSSVDMTDILRERRLLMIDKLDKEYLHTIIGASGDAICRNPTITEAFVSYDDIWWADAVEAILTFADTQRTCLATEMHNSNATCDNLLDNITDYVTRPTIAVIKDAFTKQPAILVAAGPSIDKQLHLLRREQGKAVIISCLTMLKPLLDNGIVPNYVTALDYHQISGRFFQGLTGSYPSITYVMESKVSHPVISGVKALQGTLCFVGNEWLDAIIKWPPRPYMPTGSTVAHMSFGLAQYLGCDPIIMVGQDLAYTPGKYYPDCVLKAHTWKENPEEGPKSSERASVTYPGVCQIDTGDDKILLTDEQMRAYLEIFELLWSRAQQRVIDCTAGGAPKTNCDTRPFQEVLSEYCTTPIDLFPLIPRPKRSRSNLRLVKRSLKTWQREIKGFLRAIATCIDVHKELVLISGDLADKPEEVTPEQKRWFARMRSNYTKLAKYDVLNLIVQEYSGASERGKQWNDANTLMAKLEGVELRKALLETDLQYCELQRAAAGELGKKLTQVLGKL